MFSKLFKSGFSRTTVKWVLAAAAVGVVPTAALARDRDHDDRRVEYSRDEYRRDDFRRDYGHDRDDHRSSGASVNLDFRTRSSDYCAPPPVEQRVWVEPVYRTVCEQQWVPAEYRTVTERVWKEPVVQCVTERVWVPERVERHDVIRNEYGVYGHVRLEPQTKCIPGHYEERKHDVVVCPGHYEECTHQELVCDGHYQTVEHQELLTPGHWETCAAPVAVPHRQEQARIDLHFPIR